MATRVEIVDDKKTDGCQRCLANPRKSMFLTKQAMATPPESVKDERDDHITLNYRCLQCGYEWHTGWMKHINGHPLTYKVSK
jgi:hypothetical protein